jgi:electron transfer flavoprotein alpha subunit
MDFAPSLSVKLGYPIVTDCVDVLVDNGKPKAVRQIYSGKLFSRVAFQDAPGDLVTIRSGAFPAEKAGDHKGEVVRKPIPDLLRWETVRRFEDGRRGCRYHSGGTPAVDRRGVGEADKVPIVKELADKMKGVLSCSRPVVDKNWCPGSARRNSENP